MRIKIGRVMCHSPEIVAQYQREKEARDWYFNLMHRIHGTGKHATRQRDLLRKYHPDREYIGEVGIDEKGNPYCRYRLLADFETGPYPYSCEAGIAWWAKLAKDNAGKPIEKIANYEVKKLKRQLEYLWLNLVYSPPQKD